MPGPPTIEQLRLLPEDERISSLSQRAESQWFERTGRRSTARHLGDLLVGFANAEGGLIAIGIADDGTVEGTDGDAARVNDWRQAAVTHTAPPVRHTFELIECQTAHGRDYVALVEVGPSEHVHSNTRDQTYLRIGDQNRQLSVSQAQELRFDKGESVFDGRPAPGATMRDLDAAAVDHYVARLPGATRKEVVLESRGLVLRSGRGLVPTAAGILLLGTNPQRIYPEATIRLIRYRGSSRESGARSNVARDVRLDGTLADQVEGARRRLARWIPAVIRLEVRGRFEQATVIPQFAWLEAVVNAVVHRSYSIAGDHIRVELFDDRVEVESPGRLPGLVRVENIRSTRFARNPRIARAFADLGYGRELGEGVNRMFEEMSRAGLPDPIYVQGPSSVRVTFLADTLSGKILAVLPTGSERFVELLSRTGRATTTQAVDLLGMSRPTVLGYLHRLAAAGLLEHVGTSLKDPRGFWRLRRGGEG